MNPLPDGLILVAKRGCPTCTLVEPLAVGLHTVERAGLRPGDVAQIIGAGPIGLAVSGAPFFDVFPDDIPSNEAAASFVCETGQTVTVTRASSGATMSLEYIDPIVPPVWYTFNHDILDTSYSWQSHPIILGVDRALSVQNITMQATSASTTGTAPTVTVTIRGFDRTGDLQYTRTNTLTLALEALPQLLREDVADNPVVDYITVQLEATDSNDKPAPKIHNIKVGVKPRARIPRHG